MKIGGTFAATMFLTGIVSVTGATAAVAMTTTTTWVEVDDTLTEADTCGFPITWHNQGSYRITDYFDADGTIVKTIFTAGGGLLTSSVAANGVTLTTPMVSFQVLATYDENGAFVFEAEDGIVFRFNAPGHGVVLLDTGRITFDGEGDLVSVAGPHQVWFGDVAEFCEVLSGV